MKSRFTVSLLLLILFYILISFDKHNVCDLAIVNVKVFDSVNKKVLGGRTILVNADTIFSIISNDEKFTSKKTIEGNGRLVTPGFIDTHVHLTDLFGDYEAAPEFIRADSVAPYKRKVADTYLTHGVTTIKEAGCPEKWIRETIKWQKKPEPNFPNFYTSGSAIISDEERTPYIGHVEVKDAIDAGLKVKQYYESGLKFIKLYNRLRTPEMMACMKMAKELNLNVCAHFEYRIPIDTALTYGIRHFEHVYTLAPNVLASEALMQQFNSKFFENFQKPLYFPRMLDQFNFIASKKELQKKLNDLIDQMATSKASLSTATHLFASQIGRSYFQTPLHIGDVPEIFTPLQIQRMNEGFDLMMLATKKAHDNGVKICIGTDCMNGGKAALSEMLLFYEAGFSIEEILQIATYNGAEAMGISSKFGSLEPGKKADMIIFDQNPFDGYKNFLSKKTVIKDGKVFGA
jgi:imidazolonepropionase-like amidohydrolase